MLKGLPAAIAAVLLVVTPALAQNDVCMDSNGYVDQAATAGWQNFQAGASSQLMQQLAGTWYTEIPSPQTNQIAYRYQTLEPNGLFTTQTRVCSMQGTGCGDYPGHGFWAVQNGQSGIAFMTIFSDTQVTNYCNFANAMVQGNMMQTSQGQVWQRVQ